MSPFSRRFAAFVAPPVAGLLALGALAEHAPPVALVNESPSLPEGLYVRAPGEPGPGAIVALRPPAAALPYLRRLAVPDDMRLIKRVAAAAGDRVCASRGTVRTPRRTVRVHAADRRGAPLPAWAGCRRLGAGELFLLGDGEASFDSRYFGPVRARELDGVFREMVTW